MFTLTSPADETPDQSYAELAARWKRFHLLLRRRYPGMHFEYFKVVERQQRGHAHLHILYRGGFIWQGWLSQAAARAGFGRVADIRRVGPVAAKYVSKYLAKEMGKPPEGQWPPALPKWHRRATWSRGWALEFAHQRQLWVAGQGLADYRWFMANARPVMVAMRLQLLGYELDEVDYGDVRPTDQGWELERQEPLRWRRAGDTHQPCWLCVSGDPAHRRQHGPAWLAPRPAPPPAFELWTPT